MAPSWETQGHLVGSIKCLWWKFTVMALDHSRLGLENKFLENKSGRIFCVRQVYFTKSCQQIWWRVNQPFMLFIHRISGKQYYEALVLSYRPRTEYSFHNFARQIALIQHNRNTRFLCITNYRIDHIIKRFHEENSIMSGLLNQNNLLLCGMQGLLMFDMHSILSTPKYSCKRCSWMTENNRHSD